MIKSLDDYKYYLEADRLSMGVERARPPLFGHEVPYFKHVIRFHHSYQCIWSWIKHCP